MASHFNHGGNVFKPYSADQKARSLAASAEYEKAYEEARQNNDPKAAREAFDKCKAIQDAIFLETQGAKP